MVFNSEVHNKVLSLVPTEKEEVCVSSAGFNSVPCARRCPNVGRDPPGHLGAVMPLRRTIFLRHKKVITELINGI